MNTLDDIEEVEIPNVDEVQALPTLADYLPNFYELMGTDKEGAKTYFEKFDKALHGMRGVVVFGGKPGSGKTALVLQIGFDSAAIDGIPVLIYSFEMPKREMVSRLFQRAGRVSFLKMRDTYINAMNLGSFIDAKEKIEKVSQLITIRETKDFFISGNNGLIVKFDFGEQLNYINYLKEKHGKAPIVIIDSLHEIPAPEHFRELKQKIDYQMMNLRNVCDQTGATLLLISHQSRSGQEEGGIDSFMGSASIEYTVDMAFTIAKPESEKDESSPIRELTTRKNRYGPRPKAELLFEGEFMDFTFTEILTASTK